MNQNEFDQVGDEGDETVEPQKRGFTPADDDDDPTSNPTAYRDYQSDHANVAAPSESKSSETAPSEAEQVQAATKKLQSFVAGAHNKYSNEPGATQE